MKIFLTGGAGFLGTHALLEMLEADHEVLVFDNYVNSAPAALARVREMTNRPFSAFEGDIRDGESLATAMAGFRPDAVIHLAGLKAVGESTVKPLSYYENNVQGTLSLLGAMARAECARLVFSSTATVYGDPDYLPYDEEHPLRPVSPYARSKLFVEGIIRDWTAATPGASAAILRYFNPVGAHASGRIGEDPNDIPNNLMPLICQVAVGRRTELQVYGDDYETRDGTGERDYIHVLDLARAHVAAIDFVAGRAGCEAINIGSGRGITVLEMVEAFERASGRTIPRRVVGRRPGDIASMIADPAKAERLLGWKAELGLDEICRSAWRWQSANPDGYRRG